MSIYHLLNATHPYWKITNVFVAIFSLSYMQFTLNELMCDHWTTGVVIALLSGYWTNEKAIFTCTFVYPPKFCITIVSNFSWVIQSLLEKSKTMVIKFFFFGGGGGVGGGGGKQGALWYNVKMVNRGISGGRPLRNWWNLGPWKCHQKHHLKLCLTSRCHCIIVIICFEGRTLFGICDKTSQLECKSPPKQEIFRPPGRVHPQFPQDTAFTGWSTLSPRRRSKRIKGKTRPWTTQIKLGKVSLMAKIKLDQLS